jgi:hypothetical protein
MHAEDDDADRHVDALAERFFSQDSLYPMEIDLEDESVRTTRVSARAMHATVVMLAVSLVTLGAFLVYMRLIMPVPEQLGVGGDVVLPAPDNPQPTATSATTVNPRLEPSEPAKQPGELAAPPAHQDEPCGPSAQRATDASAQTLVTTAGDAALPAPTDSEVPRIAVGTVARPHPLAAPKNDLVRRAYLSLNHGDAVQALTLARKAVIEAPKRADAWIALGSAYDAMHDHKSARQAFQSCLELANGPYLAHCRALASD